MASACQVDLNWNELWYLDFYHSRTAVRFSNYFQNSFWQGLLLQMCESQPAVRHASIAMGSWHVRLERIPTRFQEDRGGSSVTLRHSTKAIACLRESLADNSSSVSSSISSCAHKQVVLVTCLTFTLLALFQGDLDSARRHLTFGYKLFKEWEDQRDNSNSSTAMALRQAFAQMHVHWSFCSSSELIFQDIAQLSDEYRVSLNTTSTTTTTTKATPSPSKVTPSLYSGIDQMDLAQKFTTLVSGFILDYSTCGFEIGPASAMGRDAELILARLRLYRSHLQAVLIELNCLPPEDCDTLKIFSLLIAVIEIKLAITKSQRIDEMVYDDHLEQFQDIADLARALADSATALSDVTISPFSYRYSVLPALLWSAVKCRDWKVRRDLLDIMYKRPGNDHWVSATTMVLKGLIAIESSGIKPGDIVPESARVCWVNVKIQPEDSRVVMRYRRPPDDSESYSNLIMEVTSGKIFQ